MNSMWMALSGAHRRAKQPVHELRPNDIIAEGVDLRDTVDVLDDRIQKHGLWNGLLRHFWTQMLPYLALGAGVILAGPAMPLAIQELIGAIDSGASIRTVAVSAAFLSFAAIAFTVLRWAGTWQARLLTHRISVSMQLVIFRRLQRADPRWLTRHGKSASTYLDEYPGQLAQLAYIPEFIVYSVLFLVLGALLVAWFGLTGVVVLVVVALGTVLSRWLITLSNRTVKKYLDDDHQRSSGLDILVSAAIPIRRQQLELPILRRLAIIRTSQITNLRQDALRSAWSETVQRTLPQLIVWITAAVMVLTTTGLAPNDGIALIVLVRMLLFALAENLITYATLQFGLMIGDDIREVLHADAVKVPTKNIDLPGTVKISSDREPEIVIQPGSRVLVLGDREIAWDLLNLIARQGTEQRRQAEHHGDAVIVQRGQPVFDGSVADVTSLWRPIDNTRYQNAMRDSGLLSDLTSWPGGDTTPLSSTAHWLSDGETARLSIAQALAANPDVLLLDDILAPLDKERATRVAESLMTSDAMNDMTRIFATDRPDLVRHADSVIIADGSYLTHIDRDSLDAHRPELTAVLGEETIGKLFASLQPPLPTSVDSTEDSSVSTVAAGLRHRFTDEYVPPPMDAFEGESARPSGRDLWRNIRGVFPAWVIGIIPFFMALGIGTEYAVAAAVDTGVTDIRHVMGLGAIVIVGAVIVWLSRYFAMRTPIEPIDRVHTSAVQRLVSGHLDQSRSSVPGRLGRDFFALEFHVPSRLTGFVMIWIGTVIAVTTIATTGIVTIIPLTIIAALGIWSYRRSRTALVSAVHLSVASRGPLLSFARQSLGTPAFHLSPPLRASLTARFFDLAAVRATGALRVTWVRLRTLLTIELLGLTVFLTAVWGTVAARSGSAFAPSIAIYAAYTVTQQITTLVENAQRIDDTLLSIGRTASLIGGEALPPQRMTRSIGAIDQSVATTSTMPPTSATDTVVLTAVDLQASIPGNISVPEPVTLELTAGSLTVIAGPSGIGKSTLLETLSGERPPARGTIRIAGATPGIFDARTRHHLCHVTSDLPRFPWTVKDLLPKQQEAEYVLHRLTTAAGLIEIAPDSDVTDLNHSARQVLNLVRAITVKPSVVLCDEAMSALTADAERAVIAEMRAFHPEVALVIVTHRAGFDDLADRTVDLVSVLPNDNELAVAT